MSGPDTAAGGEDDRRSAGWDVRRGPRNYAALLGSQAASSALSLACAYLATRALGVAGYGAVAGLTAASQGALQLAVNWSSVAVVRFGCEEFVATGRLAVTFWSRLSLLAVNVLAVLAASPWWLPPVGRWLRLPAEVYPWVLAGVPVSALAVHLQYALQAAKLPRFQGGLAVLEKAILLSALSALTLAGGGTLTRVAGAFALAPVVPCLVGFVRLRPLVGPAAWASRPALARVLRFSYPLIPYGLVGFFSTNYLDAFFITRYLTAGDLGRYFLAYQLAGTLMQAPQLAGSLLLPFFVTLGAKGSEGLVARFFGAGLPLLSLVWGAVCLLAAAAGVSLLPPLFGPKFGGAFTLLWPLAAAAALGGPSLMGYAPFANARSATSISANVGVVCGLTNVAANFLLVPRFGLAGVAWATAASYAAGTAYAARAVGRLEPSARSWAPLAAAPAVLAAGYGSLGAAGGPAGPVVLALAGTAALLGLCRGSLAPAVRACRGAARRLVTARP